MNTVINSVGFVADVKLKDLLNKKMEKLITFNDEIISKEVYLKLDSNQSVKDKVIELKVHVPGKTLFVSESTKSFEESLDQALEVMIRQIKKEKEKARVH
jgi:putative sigma-54 modulation protein